MNLTVLEQEKSGFNSVLSALPTQQAKAIGQSHQMLTNPGAIVNKVTDMAHQKLPPKWVRGLSGVLGFDQLPVRGALLRLGGFVFASGYANLESLERSTDYRWAQQDRLTRRPAQQFTGIGSDVISLSGLLVPAYQKNQDPLSELRQMAEKGEPYLLTSGFGKVYGDWVITQAKHTGTELDSKGRSGWVTFSLSLKHYGSDN
jgi:hypothetical protein